MKEKFLFILFPHVLKCRNRLNLLNNSLFLNQAVEEGEKES